MSSWHSYGSIYNLGHRAVTNIFDNDVIIEEKIDGSQISFGLIDGELKIKSKGANIIPDHPEKMFSFAVKEIKERENLLVEGWTYRGEYLRGPSHNVLKYDRIPKNHIMIFDIATEEECYLSYEKKQYEANNLGFECTPLLFEGMIGNKTILIDLANQKSILGGPLMEGFVIKNYLQFNPEKKVLMAKHVGAAFKEVHTSVWKSENPTSSEFIQLLATNYKTEARWNKTIQHLRDDGLLTDSPKDIGLLVREIKEDILKECTEEIKDILFKHFWKDIERVVISTFPEYYKDYLMTKQFEVKND